MWLGLLDDESRFVLGSWDRTAMIFRVGVGTVVSGETCC